MTPSTRTPRRGRTPRSKAAPTLPWHALGRVVVFLDVANLQRAAKDLHWQKVDYEGIIRYFREHSSFVDARFYYGILPDHEAQRTFFTELEKLGYTLRVKKIKLIPQPDGTMLRKGNYDVDLAVEAMGLVDRYDTAVLLSGDSDFVPLVQALKERRKKVVVISSRHHVAKDLAEAATHFVDLRELATYFRRLPKKRATEPAPKPSGKLKHRERRPSHAALSQFVEWMPPRRRQKRRGGL